MKFLLVVVFLNSMLSGVAWGNRITAPTTPAARCLDEAMPPEKCAAKRDKALARGCITKEEFDSLVQYNSYPTCDFDEVGLKQLQSWCPCGCLHPNTSVAVELSNDPGFVTQVLAKDVAFDRQSYKLVTLADQADLSDGEIDTDVHQIAMTTIGLAKRPLVQLTMVDGRQLRVTESHPIITVGGVIKQAKHLRPDDLLIDRVGNQVAIRSLQSAEYKGPVVNFATVGDTAKAHVIFAGDFAVGDLTMEALMQRYNQSLELRK